MLQLSIKTNIKELERSMNDFARRQIPFATAQALTAVAKDVKAAEDAAIASVFKEPRAFTKNAVGVIGATKASMTATVFVKDIQANYMAPEEFTEPQFLGKGRKIRTPVDIPTNASGDIPRGKIKALMARPDTFMAVIHGVNGLWQRHTPVKVGARRGGLKLPRGTNTTGRLKLLVAFTRPKKVSVKLGYHDRAQRVVEQKFYLRFDESFAKAMRTAR